LEQARSFKATVATYTDAGAKKAINEDAIGFRVPEDDLLSTKGAVVVVADGVSSAEAGREAAHRSVEAVLDNYFTTPELWSVKHSIQKTLTSLNSELYELGRAMPDEARGYICTLSLMVIKSHLAYLFHVGDSRIYRLSAGDGSFTQLSKDHVAAISDEKQYLIRAMGMDTTLNIDASTVELRRGDIFFLDTDGIHDFLSDDEIRALITGGQDDFEQTCRQLVEQALQAGSDDNLSCCLLRIDHLGVEEKGDFSERLTKLPFPPELRPGLKIDGYEVLQELWASERSQLYIVRDSQSGEELVMKTPSVTYDDDPAYIERFIAEEWIGSRIDHPNVVSIVPAEKGAQHFLYYLMEKVPGITLQKWIEQNPEARPSVMARMILKIADGIFAMHAQQVVHQDLKPGNIMILPDDSIKIVDFGAVYAPGLQEMFNPFERERIPPTALASTRIQSVISTLWESSPTRCLPGAACPTASAWSVVRHWRIFTSSNTSPAINTGRLFLCGLIRRWKKPVKTTRMSVMTPWRSLFTTCSTPTRNFSRTTPVARVKVIRFSSGKSFRSCG